MGIQSLLRFVPTDDGLKIFIRWTGLLSSEDTLKYLHIVYDDLP